MTKKEQKLASYANHGENAGIRRANCVPWPAT